MSTLARGGSITVLCSLVFIAAVYASQQRGQTPPPAGGQGAGGAQAQGARGQGRGGRGGGTITIKAAHVLDGKGGNLANGVITVQGSKITAIGPQTPEMGPITYDLGNATVMPGLIDVHVHLQWYFGPNGKYGDRTGVGPEYEGEQVQANAKATLLAGFTTIQSLGWAKDVPLRAAIAADLIEGPRILTSVSQIQGSRGGGANAVPLTPDQLREAVRSAKAAGADVIKFFASASIREGGKITSRRSRPTPCAARPRRWACARSCTRTSSDSIIVSVKAGCTEIEHGLFADDAAIKAMKEANVYFDPNIGLVLQNYLENEDKYMGSGNFNEEGFASMKAALPNLPVVFKKALAAGLRMPMGTDAVAGAHGQNAREIIARVARRRPEADGRDHRRDVALGRVAQSRRHDRHARPGLRSGHRRGARRRDRGHRGAAECELRHEGGARLQKAVNAPTAIGHRSSAI